MGKAYIDVYAHFDTLGNITPVSFWWNDKQYEIDKVLDVHREASRLAGSLGIKYTCRIRGKERKLFYENFEHKWFVELPDK